MTTVPATVTIAKEVLQAAACPHQFACLTDPTFCNTSRYLERDVEFICCLSSRPCKHRRSACGKTVCSCPVKHARSLR